MRITTKLMRTMLAKLVKMALRKKFGYNVDIQLNEMEATVIDGKAHVHLNVDAELNKDELMKILKTIGMD